MTQENWQNPEVYAVKHKDEIIRASSRSGGIFTAVSDLVLAKDGIVYGCVLTKDFNAVHVRTTDKTGRDAMRGSKYIQSKLGDTYKNVKLDLIGGYEVLFTGTSCQVAGLRGFLGKEYNNLLCVDIVCHGVPSPAVWEAYIKWREKKARSKVTSVDFRNKTDFGWRDHVETLTMDNGIQVSSRVFKELFYGHNVLRPSCYECPFKSVMHPGDITIADYWGIENAAPEFDDNKGVSLVLVNNDRGAEYFERVKRNLTWKETRIEDSVQPPLVSPFERPKERERFWIDFRKKNFDYIAKKYGNTWSRYLKEKLKRIRPKLLKLFGKDKYNRTVYLSVLAIMLFWRD